MYEGTYYEKRTIFGDYTFFFMRHALVNPEDPEDIRYPIVNYIIYTVDVIAIIAALILLFLGVESFLAAPEKNRPS